MSEFIPVLCMMGIGLFMMTFGFVKMTKKQRDWVVRRDDGRCQKMRYAGDKWHQCENTDNLQVHHIHPSRAMEVWMPNLDPNTEDNLITLCKHHHVSKDGVHPDIAYAKSSWHKGDKDSFSNTFKERDLMLRRGKPYWNTLWDLLFVRRARKNTERYHKEHPEDIFPKSKWK
jgi:hypothetical protein